MRILLCLVFCASAFGQIFPGFRGGRTGGGGASDFVFQGIPFPGGGLVHAQGGGGYSGPTVIQSCSNQVGSGATVTCTFGGNITAGHPLYFCTTPVSTGATSTAWSGDAGTFTPDPGSSSAITNLNWDTADTIYATCAYVASAGGGGNVITATYTNGVVGGIVGYELSGGAFDKSDNGTTPGNLVASPITSIAVTPTANNSILIGVCFYADSAPASSTLDAGSNVAWVRDSRWTYVNYNGMIEHFGQTTAASTSAQCTSSLTGKPGWAHIAVFH